MMTTIVDSDFHYSFIIVIFILILILLLWFLLFFLLLRTTATIIFIIIIIIATYLQFPDSVVTGTPYYLSPELCKNESYNHKSDIWSDPARPFCSMFQNSICDVKWKPGMLFIRCWRILNDTAGCDS